MGNCCGKSESSGDDAFAQPGRTLGNAPARQATTARVPGSQPKPQSHGHGQNQGQGRTLGSNPEAAQEDPKAAAARAAEERAKASQGKGKLGRQLDAQKARTGQATLAQAANENRAARDADAVAEARIYN